MPVHESSLLIVRASAPPSGETLMNTLDQLQQFVDKRGQSEYVLWQEV